eukprot:21405-Pelagococcus_subviridis.AAC.3
MSKSLRIGVHIANGVVWGPVYRTHLSAANRRLSDRPVLSVSASSPAPASSRPSSPPSSHAHVPPPSRRRPRRVRARLKPLRRALVRLRHELPQRHVHRAVPVVAEPGDVKRRRDPVAPRASRAPDPVHVRVEIASVRGEVEVDHVRDGGEDARGAGGERVERARPRALRAVAVELLRGEQEAAGFGGGAALGGLGARHRRRRERSLTVALDDLRELRAHPRARTLARTKHERPRVRNRAQDGDQQIQLALARRVRAEDDALLDPGDGAADPPDRDRRRRRLGRRAGARESRV